MVRIGLTLCFLVTTLLGPGACCCWSQQFLSKAAAVAAPKKAPQTPRRTCCGCPDESEPAGETPAEKPAPHHCPCKEQSANTAPSVALRTVEDAVFQPSEDGWKYEPAFAHVILTGASGADPVAGRYPRPVPFLTADDILHRLRC